MNEKLPKPMLDGLARGAAPAEHPAADVLSGFVERGLPESESQTVAEHLARCGECREVVFLASHAADESVAEEVELQFAAEVHAPQGWPLEADARLTMAAGARPTSPPKRGPRWPPRLVWGLSMTAVALVMAGYVLLPRKALAPAGREMAGTRAAQAPMLRAEGPRESTEAEATPRAAAPAVAKPQGVAAAPVSAVPPAKNIEQASAEEVARRAAESALSENLEVKPAAAAPKAAEEGSAIAIGGASAASPLAPKSNGFAPSPVDTTREFSATDSLGVALNRSAAVATRGLHPGWRVTTEGHLEHLTAEGWTRVLADQTRAFRAVAVTGNSVWAGGDGGALFHSGDGGQHWKKVALSAANAVETGAIVSIHFDDAQHGTAVTDGGDSYVTSDGGVTWSRQ